MSQVAYLLCLVVLLPVSAYAQTYLYVPDIMIQNLSYEGLILSETIRDDPYMVRLAGGTASDMDESVVIPAGSNHAIFSIHPRNLGNQTISAILPDAKPVSASYTVYPDMKESRIDIVTPQGDHIRTTTQNVPLFLYLTDHTGTPMTHPEDVIVSLSGPESVSMPETVTIQSGTSQVYVQAKVRGSGIIYASAPGMPGDHTTVQMMMPNVSVRVGVAPNPAPPGMPLSYFVWLQKGDILYEPDTPLDIYVTSSNPAVASTRPAAMPGPIYRDVMHHSIHQGVLYAGSGVDDHRGNGRTATITVSIPDMGSGSETVRIGPDTGKMGQVMSILQECMVSVQDTIWAGRCRDTIEAFAAMGGRISGGFGWDPRTLYLGDGTGELPGLAAALRVAKSDKAPDTVRLWSFPDIPSDTYHVAAGFYYTAGGMIHGMPVRPAELARLGFTHGFADIDINTTTDIIQTHAALNVTVFGDHISGDTAHLQGPAASPLEVGLQAMPAGASEPPNGHILLAMMYAIDSDRYMTALPPDMHLESYGGVTIDRIDTLGDAVAIYGAIHDTPGGLQAHIPGYEHRTLPLRIQDGVAGIYLWVPDRVHVSEEFPVAVHSIDTDGVPISRIYDTSYVSDTVSAAPLYRMIADAPDASVATVWQSHADYRTLEGFHNAIEEVSVVPGPTRINLGDEITVSVYVSAPGATTEILGVEGMHHAGEGTYTGRPQEPGNYDVTVRVSGEGWKDYVEVVPYVVDHFVSVSYQISSDDDIPLPFQMSMESAYDETSQAMTPGTDTLIKPGVYTISAPYSINLGANSYMLDDIQINGHIYEPAERITISIDNDTAISVSYDRIVHIDAMPDASEAPDVSGVGPHRLHQKVHLYAPVYHSWGGILWHQPVIWEGILSEYQMSDDRTEVWFVADRNVEVMVIYGTSYAVPLIVAAIAAASPAILFRDRIMRLWVYRS